MKYFESNFMNDFSVIPISLSKFKKKKRYKSLTHWHMTATNTDYI